MLEPLNTLDKNVACVSTKEYEPEEGPCCRRVSISLTVGYILSIIPVLLSRLTGLPVS